MSLFPKVGRKQTNVRIIWWAVVAVLCLGVFLHLLPFYFMIATSFKNGNEIFQYPPTLWPQHPTLAAWQLMWQVTSVSLTNPDGYTIDGRSSLRLLFQFSYSGGWSAPYLTSHDCICCICQ